jgi:hypothetical protein
MCWLAQSLHRRTQLTAQTMSQTMSSAQCFGASQPLCRSASSALSARPSSAMTTHSYSCASRYGAADCNPGCSSPTSGRVLLATCPPRRSQWSGTASVFVFASHFIARLVALSCTFNCPAILTALPSSIRAARITRYIKTRLTQVHSRLAFGQPAPVFEPWHRTTGRPFRQRAKMKDGLPTRGSAAITAQGRY